MTDSQLPKAVEMPPQIADDPEERLQSWLRTRDRMGALVEWHAALDDALAQGYATGLAEGRAEGLDAVRTTLFRMLESKFSDIDESFYSQIEKAKHPQLQKYILAVSTASTITEVFGTQ